MKLSHVLNIALLTLLLVGMVATLGCDAVRGGAEVWLENVNVSSFSQNGKTIEGIPAGNMTAVLKVNTNKIYVSTTETGTVIKLSPSDAVITTGPNGISITGVDPSKIELKLQSTTTK